MSRTSAIKDTRRFMCSSDGQSWLAGIREMLHGRTIERMTFAATESGVATTLYLDNHTIFCFNDQGLALEALYERHSAFFAQLNAEP